MSDTQNANNDIVDNLLNQFSFEQAFDALGLDKRLWFHGGAYHPGPKQIEEGKTPTYYVDYKKHAHHEHTTLRMKSIEEFHGIYKILTGHDVRKPNITLDYVRIMDMPSSGDTDEPGFHDLDKVVVILSVMIPIVGEKDLRECHMKVTREYVGGDIPKSIAVDRGIEWLNRKLQEAITNRKVERPGESLDIDPDRIGEIKLVIPNKPDSNG